MKKYFMDIYGGTASIRLNRDGSAALTICDNYGKRILGKCYGSERGAKIALGKYSDEWEEVKTDDRKRQEKIEKIEHKNAKMETGKIYCLEDWDRSIEIVGIVAGMAFIQGWKLSTEPIRTDKNGNEFIRIENRTYYAYCKL